MVKVKQFLAVFFPAYLLSKILFSVFHFSGFKLTDPRLLDLVIDLVFWVASWSVSSILYVTIRDAKRPKSKQGGSDPVEAP